MLVLRGLLFLCGWAIGRADMCGRFARDNPITEGELKAAFENWMDGIIELSIRCVADSKTCTSLAYEFLDEFYDFEDSGTQATYLSRAPFHTTPAGVASFLVDNNPAWPDGGLVFSAYQITKGPFVSWEYVRGPNFTQNGKMGAAVAKVAMFSDGVMPLTRAFIMTNVYLKTRPTGSLKIIEQFLSL